MASAALANPALADDGDAMGPAHLVDLMDLEQRDGLDGRARETALTVPEERAAGLDIDGHAHDRVDDREGIGAGLQAAPGVVRDIRLVRRELGDEGLLRDRPAGRDDPRRRRRIVTNVTPPSLTLGREC